MCNERSVFLINIRKSIFLYERSIPHWTCSFAVCRGNVCTKAWCLQAPAQKDAPLAGRTWKDNPCAEYLPTIRSYQSEKVDKWFLYTNSLVQCSSLLCLWSTTTQMLSGINLPLRKNLVIVSLNEKVGGTLFPYCTRAMWKPCPFVPRHFLSLCSSSLFLCLSCYLAFSAPMFCPSALPSDMLMLHWIYPTYMLLVLPLLGLWPSHCPLFPHWWEYHWYCFQHLWYLLLPFLKNSELFHSTDSILLIFDFFVQATDIYWMKQIYVSYCLL